MQVTEALRELQQAGKIRSAWLPRMHGLDANGAGFTVVRTHHSGGAIVVEDGAIVSVLPVSAEFMATARVDVTDHATVGCLWALLVEAEGPDADNLNEWSDNHIVDWHIPAECLITLAKNVPRG